MTTFYYCSVNHQSGLQSNTFLKLSYIFKNDELVLALLKIEIFFLSYQNLDKQINSNVDKEFLLKNSSPKNPLKKILPKNFQKNQKQFKNNSPKISKQFLKKFWGSENI